MLCSVAVVPELAPPAVVLASASPRRQQFLHDLGLHFTVLATDLDETPLPGEMPLAMTQRLAAAKAQAAAGRLPHDGMARLIIACDTTVALDDTIYGKPIDADDAVRMLQDLRDRCHQVYSAVSVLHLPSGAQATRVHTTTVAMRAYTEAELIAYVNSGDPLDKAGAYGIQARPFAPVCALDGCYAGVMGLPLAALRDLLADFGLTLPRPVAAICSNYSSFSCCAATANL